MKKANAKKPKSKKNTPKKEEFKLKINYYIALPLIIIAILIVSLFLCRGWLRSTVLPKAISVVHLNEVQSTYKEEFSKLEDPMMQLGYTKLDSSNSGTCQTYIYKRFRALAGCNESARSYRQPNPNEKQRLNDNAEKLQNLLKQNGWEGEYTDTAEHASLRLLVRNITNGIDYTPDAAYTKQIGKVVCLFDANTAFSKPAPPAMNTMMVCSREFIIFGIPKGY